MLRNVKKTLMKKAMRFMQSDAGMKLMQDQRVMNVVMKMFATREKLQGSLGGFSDKLAKTMGFATQEEMQKLQAIIQDLEFTLEQVKNDQESMKTNTSQKNNLDVQASNNS